MTAVSTDGQRSTKTVRYRVLAPRDDCRVFEVRTGPRGIVSFRVQLPAAGTVKVLETLHRFVFARLKLNVAGARTLKVTVAPNAAGGRLVRHHRHHVRIRLWVTFTPLGATHAQPAFNGLTIDL